MTSPKTAAAVDLEALKRVAEAATPGPWTHDDGNVFSVPLGQPRRDAIDRKFRGQTMGSSIEIPEETGFVFGGQQNDNYDANAEFAVAFNPAVVLSLIAKLEQLRAALASVDGGADLPQLEACAELVASLDTNGLTDALRRRVMLLADWQRVRKLPSPEAVKP